MITRSRRVQRNEENHVHGNSLPKYSDKDTDLEEDDVVSTVDTGRQDKYVVKTVHIMFSMFVTILSVAFGVIVAVILKQDLLPLLSSSARHMQQPSTPKTLRLGLNDEDIHSIDNMQVPDKNNEFAYDHEFMKLSSVPSGGFVTAITMMGNDGGDSGHPRIIATDNIKPGQVLLISTAQSLGIKDTKFLSSVLHPGRDSSQLPIVSRLWSGQDLVHWTNDTRSTDDVSNRDLWNLCVLNSFSIANNEDNRLGLWILPSFRNHVCLGNTAWSILGDVVLFRAAKRIQKGEEILLSFGATTSLMQL